MEKHRMTDARMYRLQAAMEEESADLIALIPGPNLSYLSGLSFHLMERPVVALIPRVGLPALVLPDLEAAKLTASRIPFIPFPYGEDETSRSGAFLAMAKRMNVGALKVAVEYRRMRVLELRLLEKAAPQMTTGEADPLLARVRMIKELAEAQAMREAAHIAERAFEQTLPAICAGVSELEIAAELTLQTLRSGSDSELPFAPIVASGPNAALPHALPGERRLQAGDLVVIDWGAAHQGYFSDLTRTLAVGEPSDELRLVYETVRRANQAGREASRPGATAGEVDAAARTVIVAAGYGERFIHRTGHGLGLEAHEEPFISEGSDVRLEPGMTFTIEPGIYLAGVGGVRIEDDVLVTAEGAESLTAYPRELKVIAG
jgi:Xaa-Pro dipeptidase